MDYISIIYNLKEAGSRFWKQNNYRNALLEYSKALLAINQYFKQQDPHPEAEVMKLVKEIQIPCLLNMAACHLKLKSDYEKAIIYCSDVISIDPHNVKAFYRRALAYSELEKYELASKDLAQARELDPENTELRDAQTELRKKRRSFQPRPAPYKLSIFTIIGKSLLMHCKRRAH